MSESVITQSNPDLSDHITQPCHNKSRYCTRCARALKACLCQYIVPLANRAPLYILQHPNEVAHPKGTAALLSASLTQCEVHVAEQCGQDTWLDSRLADPTRRCYLLWPDEQAIPLQQLQTAVADPASVAFMILDGTWRKAYRMLHSHPVLAQLPRVTLGPIKGSYAIRKAPFAGALSTLETGYYLLSQWEQDPVRYAPLLTLFKQLNTQWQDFAEGRRA
ncbi:tRNA-uridine aminocarboxypropyltransferase [Aeromonas cavernicola]|uniref:tRNA-uridine aminocarboxypropyltransferase n=1 Tax=Aeromonas cavernicola TaxID=1006623 RepID=A0A2H9U3L1_9GAMM|nr:tRNA-uridine aminocarboxypropyltransferase [Aeromonas cavernicola]PJG58636.1 DTW domain-containing protein [Aeromonas cavernicola]